MFNKNLECIKDVVLKTRLSRISIKESSKDMSYCLTPTRDYLLMKNEVPIDDINDPRQAVKDALKSSIKAKMEAKDIIITFGIGLGYLLDETFNTYPSKIFVYEPDIELLHFVLNNVDISEHLSSGRVFLVTELDDLIKQIDSTFISKDKVEIVYLKNYAVVKNQELLQMTQKVYETCRSKMIDINTITRFSKIWLINTLTNISTINQRRVFCLSDLEGKFAGQTALILASGPSLNENIEKIKADRNKYVIFAVNKVLRTLERAGIVPDFAVCLDANHIEPTFTGLDSFLSQINCIFNLKSDNVIPNMNFKKLFVSFSENDAIVKNLSRFNSFIKEYESGGSAATFAMVSAIKMGFAKIIFCGLDLAFKDNLMYSDGEMTSRVSENEIQFYSDKKALVKVKSVTGTEVETREDYAATIHHFEQLINNLNYSEIYNTTSFGALIEGMKNSKLEDIPAAVPAVGMDFLLQNLNKINFEIKDWTQEELFLINNVISALSKGNFSPALVSSIVKSPLLYQYMQAQVLKVLQTQFSPESAEDFLNKTKLAIREVVDLLQKNSLI